MDDDILADLDLRGVGKADFFGDAGKTHSPHRHSRRVGENL
jgi:hypothetical protein